MNIKLLLILFVAIGGLSYGILSNDILLSVQKFDFLALPAMDEDPLADHDALGSFKCSCFGTDEVTGEERFDPGFCNVEYEVEPTENDPGIAAEGSLGLSGNKLCLWEAHSEDYGELILDSEEGCSSKFWLKHSDPNTAVYVWPPGYRPDYEYASIFHQVLEIEKDQNEIEKFKDEHELFKDNLNELLDNKKIDQKTKSTITWLLKNIQSFEEKDYWMISEDKIEQFNKDLLKLVEKEKLSHEDKKYLREIRDDFKNDDYDDDDKRGHDDDDDDDKRGHDDDDYDDDKRGHDDDDDDDRRGHDDDDDKFTLLDALSKKNSLKNNQKQIAKESVTAILNAAHSKVNYHYSVPEVMSITHDAMLSEDYKSYAKEFKKYNKIGGSSLCS